MTQTFVTGLFNLARREGRPRKPLAFYLDHAPFVLMLDVPLVIFTDPELVLPLERFRATHGFRAQTRVVDLALESMTTYARFRDVVHLRTFENAAPDKDTVLQQLMCWSKIEMLERAVASNPFATDHFAWIDLAIAYVADPPATVPAGCDRLTMLEMRATSPSEIDDRRTFYALERGRLAAGFMRISRAGLPETAAAFRAELDSAIAAGWRPNEQQVLSAVAACRPDLIDTYPGDYAAVLRNWDYVRRDVSTVLDNIEHCRRVGLFAHEAWLRERITASIDQGVLSLSADERARFFHRPRH